MLNTTQPPSHRKRSNSQPAPRKHAILSDRDVQQRIAAIQSKEHRRVKANLKNSSELQGLRRQIIDRWVADNAAARAACGEAPIFSGSTLSANKKKKVATFAQKCLAPSAADDTTTHAIKQKTLSAELIEQCLGLRPLTMHAPEQGILEMALSLIEEIPMVSEVPEFGRLKAAVIHCPTDIMRAENRTRAGMKLVIAKAIQSLLEQHPHRIATQDSIRGIAPSHHTLCEEELQRFIGSVEYLVDGEAAENIDLELLERFTPHLQKYVPKSMLAEFDDFVDALNMCREQKRR